MVHIFGAQLFQSRRVSDQCHDNDFSWRYYSKTISHKEESESGLKRINNKYLFNPAEEPEGRVSWVWVCLYLTHKVFGATYVGGPGAQSPSEQNILFNKGSDSHCGTPRRKTALLPDLFNLASQKTFPA